MSDSEPQPPGEADDTPEHEPIRLDQFLKLWGVVDTGGQAKQIIQAGLVEVNGVVETRRRRKLYGGEQIAFEDQSCEVEAVDEDEEPAEDAEVPTDGASGTNSEIES